ncbi:MAG TPA: hypothetical protein VJB66_04160 [Candidatus Nanoarchaeia archaeon]|nr:hypothetical protein [Candidatus Nanoarchaeia archaeon]
MTRSNKPKNAEKKVVEWFWKIKIPDKQCAHLRITELGHVFFTIGLILLGTFTLSNIPYNILPWQASVLLVLGLIVGIMDVQEKHASLLIIAFLGLLITSNAPFQNILTYYALGDYIRSFLTNLSLFLTPAVALISLRLVCRVYYAKK